MIDGLNALRPGEFLGYPVPFVLAAMAAIRGTLTEAVRSGTGVRLMGRRDYMELTYQFNCDGIDWVEVEAVFRATELGGRVGDKIRRSFENSSLVCFVFTNDAGNNRLVGMCRAITDWEYHAVIYDVSVHPELQGQGVGSAMLRELLTKLPVWRVMLVSDDQDAQRFYRRLGFATYENVMARFDWGRLYDENQSE